jgi:hypothetical protein
MEIQLSFTKPQTKRIRSVDVYVFPDLGFLTSETVYPIEQYCWIKATAVATIGLIEANVLLQPIVRGIIHVESYPNLRGPTQRIVKPT